MSQKRLINRESEARCTAPPRLPMPGLRSDVHSHDLTRRGRVPAADSVESDDHPTVHRERRRRKETGERLEHVQVTSLVKRYTNGSVESSCHGFQLTVGLMRKTRDWFWKPGSNTSRLVR